MCRSSRRVPLLAMLLLVPLSSVRADSPAGYYRFPALHGDTIVFVAEGDLWTVPASGGVAERMTAHPSAESRPAISPDGGTVAFVAAYEGPFDLYTMPLGGGLPTRHTYGRSVGSTGWAPDGRLLYGTSSLSTLPNQQLVLRDAAAVGNREEIVPLAQAADGSYAEDGTLFFTRLPFQGSHTKRYKGGTAQQIWRFAAGDDEATPLTGDYPGTSKRPMTWNGRVYFASDRDGTMNLWSMAPDGSDLRQHTRHDGWDVKSPSHHHGRIVYQLGADLRLFDIASEEDREIPIRLRSDLDHMRDHWVEKPMQYVSSLALSPDGDRVALTARGQVFVVPAKHGRVANVSSDDAARIRQARFLPEGDRLLALSDASGEVELWSFAADGVGEPRQWTEDGKVLRWEAVPSPDGKWVAHRDKDQQLWIYDVEADENRPVDSSPISDLSDLAWSPDSRFLAYVKPEENLFGSIRIHDLEAGESFPATSDRYDSYSPAWSADGKWLFFLSDRNLRSVVNSPWGSYQPEPFLDKKTEIFLLALSSGQRSPFRPDDELSRASAKSEKKDDDAKESKGRKGKKKDDGGGDQEKKPDSVRVSIEREGLQQRLLRAPVEPGNYSVLSANEKTLFFYSRPASGGRGSTLLALPIDSDDPKTETVAGGVLFYDLSLDGKRLLLRIGDALHVVEAKAAKAALEDSAIDLAGWKLTIEPRDEWRQMFVESWRLERDYFYDRDMHGVDWPAMLDKYLPLVDRVTDRDELSDLMAQMVSELAALHIFVRSGDPRRGPDSIGVGFLGARLSRDASVGGYRVEHVYRSDPDEPERASPLARPGVEIGAGAVIERINGRSVLEADEIGELLRDQTGKQVLLHVRDAGADESRKVLVEPISSGAEFDLRYHEWEYTRRLQVDEAGDGEIGYVHLRAMGGRNYTEWARDYFPAFNRKGLIVDVRHNRGGNIDSWILGRLLRKPWFYWSQRVGRAHLWNQQFAFRGHVVVLCNERTASDGEAFAEGFRRLGLGEVIGTRTWGGEIWLSSSNRLVDGGIATAAEFGVFGPEGIWLIEGWGVEPDIVVDNPPHATFKGEDAQLQAAIEYLQRKIEEQPVELVPVPEHPDKSGD